MYGLASVVSISIFTQFSLCSVIGDKVVVKAHHYVQRLQTVWSTHVGYVYQCLHKREPCGFSTFVSVSVATNVTAHDARVTSQTNFQ